MHEPWIDQSPLRIYNAVDLAARVQELGATVLIVESDQVNGPVLDLPLLAVAATRGDPNNVDLAAAEAAGIAVINTPGRNADAVAELAVALLFAVARHVVPADGDVRSGRVYADGTIPYQRYRAWELQGRTAGIVGLGAVGRATRWRFEGLGMRTIAFDPYNDEATHSLDDLLAEADVVSMHAPVLPETVGMIGEREVGLMKEGAIYLNTARAQLHDTDALVKALHDGRLRGAGLDHFVGENLAVDHPLVSMPNVVLTPHIGGATWDTEVRQTEIVVRALEEILT